MNNGFNPQSTIEELERKDYLEKLNAFGVPDYLHTLITLDVWNQFSEAEKDVLKQLQHDIPTALRGVVPESVWENLDIYQRLEFVFGHNLVTRFETNMTAVPNIGYESESNVEETQVSEVDTYAQEFSAAQEKVRALENEHINSIQGIESGAHYENSPVGVEQNQVPLSPEEVERIRQEQAYQANVQSLPKFSKGYQAPAHVTTMPTAPAGDGSDGNIWLVRLVMKLLSSRRLAQE